MARKKLLSEGEIRQFMKLANLRPIGKQRLDELAPGMEEELPGDEGPVDAGLEGPPEPALDELPPVEDDLGALGDEEGPAAEVDEELAQELAQGFADVMADVLGVAVEVEGDAAPPVDDEVVDDMEAAADVAPEGGEDAGVDDALGGMEGELDEEPPGSRMYEKKEAVQRNRVSLMARLSRGI